MGLIPLGYPFLHSDIVSNFTQENGLLHFDFPRDITGSANFLFLILSESAVIPTYAPPPLQLTRKNFFR